MPIAYREFRVRVLKDGMVPILQSAVRSTIWLARTLTADRVPEAGGLMGSCHGIHAALADSRSTYLANLRHTANKGVIAVGAVDLSGVVAEHEDGVLRAEYARILALRLVLPARCPEGCDRLLIVGHLPNYYGQESGPGPCPPHYVLRKPCGQGGCGTIQTNSAGRPWTIAGEITGGQVGELLRDYYGVPLLPAGVGPWWAPVGARTE